MRVRNSIMARVADRGFRRNLGTGKSFSFVRCRSIALHLDSTTEAESEFARVSEGEWLLGDGVDNDQRARLLSGTTFERVVDRIVEEGTLVFHKREKSCSERQYFRALLILKVDPSTVDLFHNSVSGYRAQYYDGVKNGERANAYALRRLTPRIKELLVGHEKRTCPWWWVEKSLLDPAAKVWIHQGLWLRHAKRTHPQLVVARWVQEEASLDPQRRKKATWASLTPREETRIDLKGGFLTLAGVPLGKSKRTRSEDIYELGFT